MIDLSRGGQIIRVLVGMDPATAEWTDAQVQYAAATLRQALLAVRTEAARRHRVLPEDC